MSDISKDLNKVIQKLITENLRQMKTGTDTDRVLFNDYALRWFDLQQSIISYSTARGYKNIINTIILPTFNGKYLDDITQTDIKALVAKLNKRLSPKSIKNSVSLISTVFKSAIYDELVLKNPCENIKFPKGRKPEPNPFTSYEVNRIMTEARLSYPEMALFFALGFYSGMRTGEIMGLQWADIELEKKQIRIRRTVSNGKVKESTKTYQDRFVTIISALAPYIQNHKKLNSKWVFLNYYGRPMIYYTSFQDCYWRPLLNKLGIKQRRPYQMRHTFTVLALKSGEDLNWIRLMLGHADLAMITHCYGKNFLNLSGGTKLESCFNSDLND